MSTYKLKVVSIIFIFLMIAFAASFIGYIASGKINEWKSSLDQHVQEMRI